MSAEERETINALLRAAGDRRSGSWTERRAAMEATTGAFPLAPGIACKAVSANGVAAEWQARAGAPQDAALLYLHGGGYAVGSIVTHRPITTAVAAQFEGRVLSLAYRLAPEHPCPAAIDDALAAYRFLLDEGVKGSRIVIAGDSAGGGLTLATLQAIRKAGLPRPAGGWCLSPWADLTQSGATMRSKAAEDLIISAAVLDEFAAAYVPGGDRDDPRATPLNGAFEDLPPLLVQVGGAETLLDDSIALAGKAAAANVDVRLEVFAHQQHVFQMFAAMLSEGRDAIAAAVAWANARLA